VGEWQHDDRYRSNIIFIVPDVVAVHVYYAAGFLLLKREGNRIIE